MSGLLVILALCYVFAKMGGKGLGMFGVKLAQFSFAFAMKYFKYVLIFVGILFIISLFE